MKQPRGYQALAVAWREKYDLCAQGDGDVVAAELSAKLENHKKIISSPRYKDGDVTWPEMERRTFLIGPFGLGLGARIHIAVELIGIEQLEGPPEDPTWPTPTALAAAGIVLRDKPIRRPMIAAVVARLGAQYRKTTVDAFENTPFTGPGAVADFRFWLIGKPVGNLTLLEGNDDHVFHSTGREGLVDDLHEFLNPDCTDDRPAGLIQIVKGDGLEFGLRALANLLSNDLLARADERPIGFFPVSRYLGKPRGNRDAISTYGLVANLLAFCRGDLFPVPPLSNHRELADAIAEIRTVMARHPMVFVFDAWAVSTGSFHQIHSLSVGDGLADLLVELVRPRLDLGASGPDPDLFFRNRILILTEGEHPDLEDYEYKKPMPLQAPAKEDMPAILESRGHKLPDLVVSNAFLHATMRRDVTVAVIEDYLARGWPVPRPIDRQLSFDEFTKSWLRRLADEAPLDLLLLRFIAVAREGLRVSTLHRLVTAWSRILEREAPKQWVVPESYSTDLLNERLDALIDRRVLISGTDVSVPGIDDTGLLGGVWQGDGAESGAPRKPRHFVDLPSASLRHRLLTELRQSHATKLGRIHRLVAERALDDHTKISRLSEWDEIFGVDHYRRLVLALFQGFSSLAATSPNEKAALKRLYRNLPADQLNAYLGLYAVYYRGLMERPPEWELSRTHGREDLKIELLLLAMNIDKGEQKFMEIYDSAATLGARPTGLLRPETQKSITWEQGLSLARAAFHNNRIDLAGKTLEYLEGIRTDPALGKPEADHRLANFAKIQADIGLVANRTNVGEKIETHLVSLGLLEKDIIADIAAEHRPSAGQRSLAALDTALTKKALEWSRRDGATPDQLIAWSDLLSRLAEAGSLAAAAAVGNEVDETDGLYIPFVYMFMAERLRRRVYEMSPLSRDFYLNGHSTRVLVRTVLTLIEAIDTLTDRKDQDRLDGLPQRQELVDFARRHKDMLSRYMSRLPTERPSLLIMDAHFARVVSQGAVDGLKDALTLLDRADAIMSHVRHRPRVRLRFSQERSIALRSLALKLADDSTVEHAYLRRLARMALSEAKAVRSLAAKTPSWVLPSEELVTATKAALSKLLADPKVP